MKMKQFNEEVYFSDEKILKADKPLIVELKQKAMANTRKRVRLCSHKNIDENIHEMLIVHTRDTYVRPHKHLNKIESFTIIEGEADVILFDEEGNVVETIKMGEYGSGLNFYYRIDDPYYHTLVIKSDVLVFHEVTNGPFDRSGTVFADWSPGESDQSAVTQYLRTLSKEKM